jgi:DNA (cytosine-5)-methyltransferase 1
VPTLNVLDNASATRATVLIIDGTRVNDVRVYEDGIVPTVVARYGTGGGNVPMVFSHTQGLDVQASEENSPTLRAGGAGMAVVYPIQNTVIGRADENGPGGKGYKDDGEPMFTVDTTSPHAVALAFDLYNQQVTEKNQTLSAAASDASHTGTIWKDQTVRRLTPVECERLQGFPDDWTSGQADSNRYKQMGNAVAVPVVQWIVGRLVAQLDE